MESRELQAVEWLVFVRIDVGSGSRDAPALVWIQGHTSGERVEARARIVEVRTHLVRMRPVEYRLLEMNLTREHAQCRDAKAFVRDILRMMAERDRRVVRGGRTVQVRDGPECRLADRREVDRPTPVGSDRAIVHDGDFAEQLMRMHAIRDRAAAVR